MKMTYCKAVLGVLGSIIISSAAFAAPIAPHPALSKTGKQLLAAQPGKKVPDCPTAAAVVIPAYPGSLCLTNITSSSNGKKDPLEILVLVSRDVPGKVRNWYANRLKGWKYDSTLEHFASPDWSFDKIMTEPQVEIKKATATNLAIYKLSYELSGIHTLVNIYYKPRHGAAK